MPGPGEYSVGESLSKDRTISYKMSMSERKGIVGKDEGNKPGPGMYESPVKMGSNAKSVIRLLIIICI
jgi:hypothetical protein